MMPDLLGQPTFWIFAIPAVILIGLAKGGFVGIGNMAVPLLALAISPVQAAAILLPVLLMGDAVGVWAFRRTWDGHVLALLIPTAALGIGLGWWFAASVSDRQVGGALGVISILFAFQRLWIERGGRAVPAQRLPDWVGALCGMAAGFTSQIAHAGAPPYQIYVLPRRLPRDVLVGTTAITFAAINWIKVPAYIALGQFTATNLIASAALMPVTLLSTLAGVKLVRKVPAERFYTAIYILTALVGVKLVWDALA